MNAADFRPGDRVRYFPPGAAGGGEIETGIVTAVGDGWVQVLYDRMATPMATDPEDLVIVEHRSRVPDEEIYEDRQ